MERTTSPLVSIYRSSHTVDTLKRIHNVTGQEFAVCGDAPLRAAWEDLEPASKMDRLHTGDIAELTEPPC